mgnify:CR=1 FL=1
MPGLQVTHRSRCARRRVGILGESHSNSAWPGQSGTAATNSRAGNRGGARARARAFRRGLPESRGRWRKATADSRKPHCFEFCELVASSRNRLFHGRRDMVPRLLSLDALLSSVDGLGGRGETPKWWYIPV